MSESEMPLDANSSSGGDPAEAEQHEDPVAAGTAVAEAEFSLSQTTIHDVAAADEAGSEYDDDDDDDENFMAMLPSCVKNRVEKLKELNTKKVKITEDYLLERAALEKKFNQLYAPLYAERAEVVNGKHDEQIEKQAALNGKVGNSVDESEDESVNLIGVPEFWSCAMANFEIVSELLTESDNDCLLNLEDIQCEDFDDGKGFTLTFHFKDNDFFTNRVLTKRYEVPNLLLDDEPILKNVKGCEIDWKPNMCLTFRETLKKQRNKSGKRAGQIRTVKKKERSESFFHFFSPPKIPNMKFGEIGEEEADAIEEAFDHDYEVAQAFRSHIIPKAALWFTGEAMQEEIENMMQNGELPSKIDSTISSTSSPFPPPQTGSEEPECKQN